jgi:transposase
MIITSPEAVRARFRVGRPAVQRSPPPPGPPGHCRGDAAFAMLGTAPTPAPSSKTMRYWLFRSGDRQINRALCTPFSLCRLQRDERTRIYAERRRAEGKTDREIKRCLKRYIARELNPRPESPPLAP